MFYDKNIISSFNIHELVTDFIPRMNLSESLNLTELSVTCVKVISVILIREATETRMPQSQSWNWITTYLTIEHLTIE